MMSEEEKYLQARKKVEKMKRFYKHLSSWMFTSLFLMVLFFVLRMPPWITFVVVAGWGIGIAAEAVEVFGFPGIDRNWEDRKIREEMERMEASQPKKEWQRPMVPDENESIDETLELPDYREVKRKWNDSDLV
ncbi:MAG: 2TM domain-containing protein [Saprospiraceae bacterium]|nr:2TM domain-containing protein [Saprospiraceae bacterium]